jgi:hypothetical protein
MFLFKCPNSKSGLKVALGLHSGRIGSSALVDTSATVRKFVFPQSFGAYTGKVLD